MTHGSRRPDDSVNDVFGDVLPDVTSDERDRTPPAADDRHDDWLRENRPPHHA